ncbi:hypothetical protein GPU96_09g16750 [Encephalitozoon hellem]|uniref:Uncharacterized protein n=2 Tax=Encephalitozoon hellem TaxID=27973 RepID=A0A9Q9C3W9_ENCHE|nr:hypothetical protein GPU96_01g00050 [Encephalitozoon hellem]UTX42686.1 hypothetical protein GPU96_02g04020 [Encephalitozoon hellem]UTX42691.1 hypothetical protein GPU96_03g04110 [Encephalitozoon hellem]UTX42872.1 hypothetical protein GPU96_03g05960 [Encephalitozoon hellem]UTX42877.1 hypothetical protein GPU96_04g06050 [Encephalitozoon hellem]
MESRADDGMDTSGDLETYRQTKMKEIEGLEQRVRSIWEALDRLKDCDDERIKGSAEDMEREVDGIFDELGTARDAVSEARSKGEMDDVYLVEFLCRIEKMEGDMQLNTSISKLLGFDGIGGGVSVAGDCVPTGGMEWQELDRDLCSFGYLSEMFDRWDECVIKKRMDFPLAFVLRHYCCLDDWGCVHEIYILVVPLGNNFFLMARGGTDEELKHFCSAGCSDEEFNGDGGPSLELLYASKRELSGIDSSVFDEVINKEYIDGEGVVRRYGGRIRRHRAFFSSFELIIMKEYNPGGNYTSVREVLIGRVGQPYFAQMIRDMKGFVSTVDPFRP